MDKPYDEADFRFLAKKGKHGYREVDPPKPSLEGPVADTHAHLSMLADPVLSLARCAVYGVAFVCVMTDPTEDAATVYENLDSWRLQAAGRGVHAESSAIPHTRIAIGCHPHNARLYDDDLEKSLVEKARDTRTCAIGEVGLDYHYDFSPRPEQIEVLRRQIALSHTMQLPLILHLREAHDEAFHILEEEGFPDAGVLLHCFNLGWEDLKPWLDRGCYAAFGGAVTFKKSEDTRKAAANMPLSRMLTETDAPYMAPEPMRGMACGPEHTIFTAARLAEVCGCVAGDRRKDMLSHLYNNALDLLDRAPSAWQQGGTS